MSTPDLQVKEAFVAIADLAHALGVERIDKLPGCWELQVDEQWWIAVNGHTKPMRCSKSEIPIEPIQCYIEFNGWPAGIIGPGNGVIAAGAAANEDTFIAALRKRAESP